MPLKCSFKDCSQFNLADFSQIAFYQDLITGGWNLALGPEYVIPDATIPVNIRLVGTSDERFPYNVFCVNCRSKVGVVNLISGFEQMTVNFSCRNSYLSDTRSGAPANKKMKWSKLIDMYPDIRRITTTIPNNPPVLASDTVHFHSVSDLDDIIRAGKAVASKSDLSPKDYQWRGFCFACFNSVLLCLPTGMGKTLIACMLMKAYQERNPSKGQVFIVPTVVLVEQQATAIERNTGLSIVRRSGDEFKRSTWSMDEICVCTAAMLINALKLNQIAVSQISLLIFDEVHLAKSTNSDYGRLLPYITRCPESKRPRVIGLTASPCSNESDMRQTISSLCSRLGAVPHTPLLDDSTEKPNQITCNYVSIEKTVFEMEYEKFVIETLNLLSGLHGFFKANWKDFPQRFSVQSKIDTMSKSISLARLVGQDENDIQLLQLAALMRKWLDSLNILQIFGPVKLIELIRADLDHMEKDGDCTSKHFVAIAPILHQLRQSVEKVFTEHEVVENSPRVSKLLNILSNHRGEQERILIFVERRSTAERLCRRLKDDPIISEMNPISVMGNTNCGSTYKDVQQTVLTMFRAGECRLLVATSVLEQGIDVALCGLVICFDGIKSVKSIIQARGRARMEVATFIAFVPADKQQRANQLSQLEVTMNYTIRQLMTENHCVLDQDIADELDQFLLSDDRNSAEDYLVRDDESEGDNDDEEVENNRPTAERIIKLRFLHFVNSTALLNHIKSSDRVKVTKRYVDAYYTVSGDRNTSRIMKEVSSITRDAPRFRSWIEVNENSHVDCIETNPGPTTVVFGSLTGFFFEDFTTVNFDSNPIWSNGMIDFHIRNNEMEISTNNRQFRIHAINVETILINDTTDSFEIFLCLRRPPEYFIDKELAHFDFATTSFNLCLQRKSSIECESSTTLRTALYSFTMNVYNVCNLKRSIVRNSRPTTINRQPAKVHFMTEYFIKVWHSSHAALLPTILPQHILERFYKCASLITLKLLLNNTTPIRFQKLKIRNIQDVELPFLGSEDRNDSDYVSLCRVNVTPTRFVYLPMQSVQKNRIFRYYPDPENFLLICFTDDNGGNPWRSENICNHFLAILRNGITIGEKTFTFLGCSNSQLREGRCWFSTLNRDDVYDKIGEFPDTWSAGRKLTRLALAFASSTETVVLNERYMRTVENDVEMNGINFSDGIGKASHSLVEKVQSVLKLSQKPSAFQIRVGGIKGVISAFHQEDEVTFRKSMKKFESSHNTLEVLNYSRSLPLYLNRHVILLLSSFGISNEIFLDMQHKMLMNCMDTLVDDDSSLDFVKSHSPIFNWELFPIQHLLQEPFFTQMLMSNSIDLISNITNHSHIPVKSGRILMGVLDETQTLDYGEIYAHIVENGYDYELDGRVLIFRNPCVLPSDIRILMAKKGCSALRNLYTNCLVMPSKGPSSHASECSGGDLDGDLFYVIWDENLIPKDLAIPGEKVIEVRTEETAQLCHSQHESMLQFYCDYVSKNQLGIIANAHLAVADQFNMRDERSIELAKYVTAETDAPKKGYTVGKVPTNLLPRQYPDFMQKRDKQSYRSETILGELFRQSKPILEVFLEKRHYTTRTSKFNITGDTKSIENCYAAYCYEIKTLLQSFDLELEVDLFSGTPIWNSEYLSTYKQQHQLRQNVLDEVGSFWLKWRNIFENWRSTNDNDQQKILEWYSRPKSSPWPIHSFSFLAMPHVNFDECNRKSISQKIFDSTHRWVMYNKIRWLNDWRMRYNIYETVVDKLNGIECHLYGSSALGLNEQHSDIDLCATSNDFDKIQKSLYQMDHNVEILKRPHCVALNYESQHIEVTNFLDGVWKTNALAGTLDRNAECWAALKVLVEWARIAKIVKSCGSEGLMTVISFCHLFVSFATTSQAEIEQTPPTYTLKRVGRWIDSIGDSKCGTLIYDFLKEISSRNRLWLLTKVDPLTKDPLIKRDLVEELRQSAEVALCILSVHDGDIQKLFEFCTKKRLFRLDKRYVDPHTSTEASRNSCLKELKTVCNPTNTENLHFELTERNGVYYVEVSGEHKYFADVEKGINKIHWKLMNVRVREASRRKTYHVMNGTMILLEFGNGPSTEVSFSSYDNERYHVLHMGIWKSTVKLRDDRNMNWRQLEYQRYEDRFLKQMALYQEKQRSARKTTSRSLRFLGKLFCRIRCGHHYFFHIPEALHNTFETISLQNVEKKVAHMEENLELERQHDIIQDIKNYNSSTLVRQPYRKSDDNAGSLALMPLHELKMGRGQQQGNKSLQFKPTSKRNDVNGIRHSFYTNWNVPLNRTKEFLASNGFKETPTNSDDYYTSLTVFWRQRELNVFCDKFGKILEIKHRKVRWLSATINKIEDDCGHDVRVYLESQTPLDDDESSLNTVIEYLDQRSILTETFSKQLAENLKDQLSTKPLISDIFHLNWRFRSMRVVTAVAKFVNADNDECVLSEIHDGIFHAHRHEFEWFPSRFEFEVRLSMDNISTEELCKKSYDLALKVFDHAKSSCGQ